VEGASKSWLEERGKDVSGVAGPLGNTPEARSGTARDGCLPQDACEVS
jgi:hypothetical protein